MPPCPILYDLLGEVLYASWNMSQGRVQIGVFHSSSMSWRLLRTKVLCLSSWLSRCWFQICVIFSPYLGKWSNLTNILSNGLKPPSSCGLCLFCAKSWNVSFLGIESVYRFLFLHLFSTRKMSFSEESRTLREEASRATWWKDEGDTGECLDTDLVLVQFLMIDRDHCGVYIYIPTESNTLIFLG